ncbi:MAG: diguanylate cyclase [Spirochaetes bacterium]|nr:diguanylate cyclase [Spirochaetota bacterium]
MKFNYYLNTGKRRFRLRSGETYTIGRNPDNDIFITDTTVSRTHARLSWDQDTFIIEDLNSTNGIFLNGSKISSARLNSKDSLRIGRIELQFTMTRVGVDVMEETISPEDSIILENRINELMREVHDPLLKERFSEIKRLFSAKKRNLSDLAYRDTLTGLYNRRSFEKKLADEWKRRKRYRRPLGLIMIDIDHFKEVNDTYGHQKGDSVLQTVAGIINDNVRSSDFPCRYGGEEIAIILSETLPENAGKVAEKLRLLVETQVKEIEGILVTISLGVSSYADNMNDPGDIIKAADSCLYKAKDAGRNRVVVS